MLKTFFSAIFGVSALSLLPSLSNAIVVYSDNFDVDSTANWTTNASTGNNAANIFFDYSTVGIPAAPNSTGGSTRGVKLEANYFGGPAAAAFTGLSVSPIGQSFTGDYTLQADVWLNVNGPFPGGGSGSTQAGGLGIMTDGTSPQWAGAGTGPTSIQFNATGDGNSAADYRAYTPAGAFASAQGVFAAGSQNNSNAYYATFPGVTAPTAQLTLFPTQTGTTNTGAIGMGWHVWTVKKSGGIVEWSIDGKLINTITLSTAGTTVGNNILLNYYDTNTTASTQANSRSLLFGLYDNVVVSIPEPGAYLFGSVASTIIGMIAYRRRKSA